MKNQTVLLAVGAALISTSSLVFSSPAQASIRSDCIKEWGTDYRMIDYCVRKQTAAYNTVRRIPNNGIKRNCVGEWGTDYRMVSYCNDKQSTAKSKLGL